MAKLFLLRHFKSQWNLENRFTGWVDVPLTKGWENEAKKVSKKIFRNKISSVYSSPLVRNENSVLALFENIKKYPIFIHLDKGKMKRWGKFKEINKNYIPVYISQNLNERYYGRLQGENKVKMMKKYGKEQVHLWRRGFSNVPPGGESLRGTYRRAAPFYRKYVEKDLKKGKNVLIVASHNSLRALIKHIEKISNEDIINVEVGYGGLLVYQFDKFLNLKKKNIVKK